MLEVMRNLLASRLLGKSCYYTLFNIIGNMMNFGFINRLSQGTGTGLLRNHLLIKLLGSWIKMLLFNVFHVTELTSGVYSSLLLVRHTWSGYLAEETKRDLISACHKPRNLALVPTRRQTRENSTIIARLVLKILGVLHYEII